MTTKMADASEILRHAQERCNLLIRIKTTVDGLLERDSVNIWSTYGGLSRITEDLEEILRHGLREQQGLFGDNNDYTEFLRGLKVLRPARITNSESLRAVIEDETLKKGKAWVQHSLLDHRLSVYLTKLVENKQHLEDCYYEYAFLRSRPHFEALCTCLRAIEKSNPGLLSEVDHSLLNKGKYIEKWLNQEECSKDSSVNGKNFGQLEGADNEMVANEVFSVTPKIAYSDSAGSDIIENVSMISQGSPRGIYFDTQESPIEIDDSHSSDSQLTGQNFSISPKDLSGSSSESNEGSKETNATKSLNLPGLRIVEPRKNKRGINQVTLAQAALSAVLETEESPSSEQWFEGSNKGVFPRERGHTNDNNISKIRDPIDQIFTEPSTLPMYKGSGNPARTTNADLSIVNSSINSDVKPVISYHEKKKAFGHSRSKSDQIRDSRTRKHVLIKEPEERREKSSSLGESPKLSSSLPASSEEYFYKDSMMYANLVEGQSLMNYLATHDFSSCELDKENAHFSISEALIEAIEQMKCDSIPVSEDEEEDDDDEEIKQLKQEIERRRLEKKQEKITRLQPAFSDDGTGTKSTESKNSSASGRDVSSSSSDLLGTDSDNESDLSGGWERVAHSEDEDTTNMTIAASTDTLVAETEGPTTPMTPVDGIEASTSPLTAEAVAKSLLQKFANKKHPLASELHWLVSEEDAPQSLLPLPQTIPISPDDVSGWKSDGEQASGILQHKRRVSMPCRIRGNQDWAPPRPQIIFHVQIPPKRKTLMMQQNYRCAGCGMRVAQDYMKRFRYCNYLGKYFCSSCHENSMMVIPAKIIRKWDFKKYEVSNFARDLLNKIHSDPLFNIKDINSSLYKSVRLMEEIRDLRLKMHHFRNFVKTCRKAKDLAAEYSKIPEHIFSEPDLYSIQDFLQVKSGDLRLYFKSLGDDTLRHIDECPLCQAKGFICEYCKDGDDVIFPFELNRVARCTGCRGCFHKDCYVEGKCPKCERVRIRRSMILAPSPTDDDADNVSQTNGVDLR